MIESWIQAYEQVAKENRQRLEFLERLYGRLDVLGIEILPLKGMDLLLRAYPDLGRRPMSDMDFLIHADHLPAILRVLEEEGFHRVPAEGLLRQSFVEDSIACISAQSGLIMDLHWGLGFLPGIEAIWQRRISRKTRLGDRFLLHPEDTLLILITYVVAHRGRLSSLLTQDLEALLKQESQEIEWNRWVERAQRLGLGPAVSHGLAYVRSRGFQGIPGKVVTSLQPRTYEERLLAYFYYRIVTENETPDIQYLFPLVAASGWRAKARLIQRSLFPSQELAERRMGTDLKRFCRITAYVIRPLRLCLRGMYFMLNDLWRLIQEPRK